LKQWGSEKSRSSRAAICNAHERGDWGKTNVPTRVKPDEKEISFTEFVKTTALLAENHYSTEKFR